jgi:hypothetical protein
MLPLLLLPVVLVVPLLSFLAHSHQCSRQSKIQM